MSTELPSCTVYQQPVSRRLADELTRFNAAIIVPSLA
jgi:hypothetical protein